METRSLRPRGRLLLKVEERGAPLVVRRASNIVLRGGATLIARLFCGDAAGKPIDSIGIGFATDPATTELTALTAPPAALGIPAEALKTALPAASFTVVTDQASAIQVNIAALFKPTQELADVSEAGLLAGNVLYNQVIFEPVTLRVGQDVTFFWQIDFPFGH
jgi:hypothetical protein